MARQFKIHSLNSDGTETDRSIEFEVIDPSTNKPFVENGKPSVIIMMRPISPSKYREVVSDHTERVLNRKTRAMEDQTDWDAVQDALTVYAVQSWRGIIGADDKPLDCVHDAKLGLPGDLKNELVQRAMQGASVDTEQSFRSAS